MKPIPLHGLNDDTECQANLWKSNVNYEVFYFKEIPEDHLKGDLRRRTSPKRCEKIISKEISEEEYLHSDARD